MRIVYSREGLAQLEAPSDFTRFSLALDSSFKHSGGVSLSAVAEFSDDGHAWIAQDLVRSLAGRKDDKEWEASFSRMIQFAQSRGWAGPHGRIRAHIEYLDQPPPVEEREFRRAMRRFASGVSVVASGSGDARFGMTVSAFSSVSADPPLILVCLNANAFNHDGIVNSRAFSVNILASHQRDIATTFSGGGDVQGADRFSPGDWRDDQHGAPVLVPALQSIMCTPVSKNRAGSHTVLIGRVISVGEVRENDPLVIYDGELRTMSYGN